MELSDTVTHVVTDRTETFRRENPQLGDTVRFVSSHWLRERLKTNTRQDVEEKQKYAV